MSVFMAGFLVTMVPGLITGWVVGGIVGWVMRRDSYCRHPVPVMVPVFGERVSPPVAPPVIHVHVHPDAALCEGCSPARVVEGRVVDRPAVGGHRRFTNTGTGMTGRGYPATR
jgi:hypothetical protein